MNISDLLDNMGVEHKLVGDGEFQTLGLVGTRRKEKVCSFIGDKKYICDISDSIQLLLATEELNSELKDFNLCIVEKPRDVFFKLHEYIKDNPEYMRCDTENVIAESSKISNLAFIADKNVKIGEDCVIEEFVSIKENTTIGDRCVIRAGTIIGGEGFEFKKRGDELFPVSHIGGVTLGNDVEIQQNACIDKAIYPLDDTVIGDFTKIDNLVHIAHGVRVGKRVMVVANTCVAGRVFISDDAWVGPVSAIRNGTYIGTNSRVNMGSVVTQDVEDGKAVSGNFAIEHSKFLKNLKQQI